MVPRVWRTMVRLPCGSGVAPREHHAGVASGEAYHVEVVEQPPTLFCSVANHAGTVGASNVTNVDVSCACAVNLADCDGDLATGCEVDMSSDDTNCGACGVACGIDETCQAGACIAPDVTPTLYRPAGLQASVLESTVLAGGWTMCIVSGFGSSTPLSDLLEHCTGSKIMFACRPELVTPGEGQPAAPVTLSWLAWTSRQLAFAADSWDVDSNGATWTSSYGAYMEAGDGTNFIWRGYDPATSPRTLTDGGCGPNDYWTDAWAFVVYQAD